MGSDSKISPPAPVVVLFDGYCNLCTTSVQFIIKHDRKKIFRFASLQSAAGRTLLQTFNVPQTKAGSVVLIAGARAYTESTAALHIARRLSGLWPFLFVFMVVPPFIRDAVYRFVARNRFRWFGKRSSCWIPDDGLRARFLDP
ncbi:MAG: thiol-disulfide oxidoreductase [Cyclobacteriaceae bacterium]|nr:MAG: thiol-disulfide oxidoreductase [Cyclobacteriaceae bacterium]